MGWYKIDKNKKITPVADGETLKALDTDSSGVESFFKGFTHSFDEYAASFNKFIQENIVDRFIPDKYNTHFYGKNAEFWNKQKHLNELETAKHPYSKLAGEILLDPLNFTPAGIATKGAKAARIAKSVAGGAAVGAGTMAFKNYGDQSKSTERKQEEVATGAAIGAIVNGVIAALTKGKIKNVIKDETNPEEAKKVLQALADNPEAFGLTKSQAEQAGKAAMSVHHKHNPEEAKQFWREVINPNDTGYRQDWRYAVPEGQYPAKADMEVQPITTPRPAGLLEHKPVALENKDVIYQGWDKEGILPPPHYPIERTRPGAIESEAAPSIPREKPQIEAGPQQETRTEPKSVEYENITDDPLFYYALDLARNRSYKDLRYDKRVSQKRGGTDTPDGGHINWGQVTEPNYEYDFSLTKSDVKKIEKALEKGEPIPQDLMEKVKSDIGVLENHPSWRDEAQAIRHEAETLFANGGSNLAQSMGVGAFTGTANAYESLDEYSQGKIGEDELAKRFVEGFLAGTLGGYAGLHAVRALRKASPNVYEKVRSFVLSSYNPDGTPKFGINIGMFAAKSKDLDTAALEKAAIPEPPKISLPAFMARVKDGIETPIGKMRIDFDYFLNKAIERDSGARIDILHLIEPTLKEPASIVKYKDTFNFIKPFIDEKNRVKKFLSVVSDRDGNLKMVSSYRLKNTDIKNILKNGEIVADFVGGATSPALVPPRAGENLPKAGNPLQDIISQDDDSIKLGMFTGSAPKLASEQKEFAPHLKKIVAKELEREWKDVDRSIKGWVKYLLTNTFSADYLKSRDKLYQAKNAMTQKAYTLHQALNKLPQEERIALHEYLVGDRSEVSEELKAVADNIKATIKELTNEVVKEGILSKEAVKEWEDYYLKRIYQKHFLPISGFGKKRIEKVYERGNTIKIGNGDTKELQKFLQPLGIDASGYKSVEEFVQKSELLQKRLKDGGIRAKKLPNGKWELKRDWTYDERTNMDEIRDAAVSVPNTLVHLSNLVEHARFLKEIASVDGAVLTQDMAKQFSESELKKMGFDKLPNSARYGALAGMWIRRDVRSDIDEIGKNFIDAILGEDNPLSKIWFDNLRLWKKSKTVWNAPAHVNNFMSNIYLMHLSGMSAAQIAASLGKAGKMMVEAQKYKDIAKRSLIGQASPKELQELQEMQKELKYYLEAENMGLLNTSALHDILLRQAQQIDSSTGTLQKADELATKAYQIEDEINKLAMYALLREKGWSKDEAREAVEAVMPDYTRPMPRGFRFLRDTGVSPFVAWTYYTFPKIFALIKTKEGAWQATKALGALYLASYAMSGISPFEHIPGIDTDMPEWTKGRYIPIAKEGNDVTMLKYDRWIPYLQLLAPHNLVRDMFSGPTINFIVSTLGGVKPYNKRPITYENKPAYQQIYDYAKYYTQSFVPLPQQLYSAYDVVESKLRSKESRRTDAVIEPRSGVQSLLKLLGINTLTYNKSALKREQRKRK